VQRKPSLACNCGDSNAGFICGNKDGIAIGSTITKADAVLNKVTLSVASSGTMQSALLVADSGILIGNPSGNIYPITCTTSEEGIMLMPLLKN
jgi:hypothetical protein